MPGAKAVIEAGSLASNEASIGLSGQVARAVRDEASSAHLYPDALCTALRDELAAMHDVSADQILVGNGSDELIFLLALAYLAGGGRAVCADPAYKLNEISTLVVGGTILSVPLLDWVHDLDSMSKVRADVAYLVNPHNPTGTFVCRSRVEQFRTESRSDLVVVDEAYVDFVDRPESDTAIPLVSNGGLVVIRTFSKAYALAGCRVGYLVGPTEIVETLRKVRAPFSVNRFAQVAARAALQDHDHYRNGVSEVLRIRDLMTAFIRDLGLEVIQSSANFVLVLTEHESELVKFLAKSGIAVRPGTSLGLPGSVRISVPSQKGWDLLEPALSQWSRD